MSDDQDNPELARLEAARTGREPWRLWGPYLSERAWGTVREDYSAEGSAWEHFDFAQAASRVFRWSEDGIAGICDAEQRLIFALSLWNGVDPILKERLFGLSGNQGNHGEDVKECYFHLDATPSHSWLRHRYKYPQRPFPYDWLIAENARRSRADPPVSVLESSAFADDRYWDIEVRYAKAGPEHLLIRLFATNRGPEPATIWLLPTLWFRNTWAWGDAGETRPSLKEIPAPKDSVWAVRADHPGLGTYYLYGRREAERLFTDNESNRERLWGVPNASPYTKDAFDRYLVQGERTAVNPEQVGTKLAAVHRLAVDPGETVMTGLVLSRQPLEAPFARWEATLSQRQSEATVFYDELLPNASAEDHRILRQALAGLIWSQQFYHVDVARWLDGDGHAPPAGRRQGRNHHWRHLHARQVGIPLVRRLGPGLPRRRAGPRGRRPRQGPGRASAQRAGPAPQRAHPRLRVGLRRRQPAHPRRRGAQGLPRRAGTARARGPGVLEARAAQAPAALRLVDQPQGPGGPQRLRRRLPRARQRLRPRPLAALAAGLQPQAGRRHRLDGHVRVEPHLDRAGDRGR
ncbi:MAG: hypothetical protein MUC77_13570 [Chromatiaceae bacterium]|nr:hypothetical protein [Chromatiaceae bacterium]